MISRRNYFAITLVMLVVFFLFQFTGSASDIWNDYGKNPYAGNAEELPGRSSARDTAWNASGENILYVGKNRAVKENIRLWALYSGRGMETAASLPAWDSGKRPDILALDGGSVCGEAQIGNLRAYLENGCHVIFCGLPEPAVIRESESLRGLLGIRDIREEEAAVDGIRLYGGFLLGGEAVYLENEPEEDTKRQDMDLDFTWYELQEDTEVYMEGMTGDIPDTEKCPPVIWKTDFQKAGVFAVNGSYMEEVGGFGLLSAMLAQVRTYDIYPVVNAQNMVAVNYPVLADENREELMQYYSRSMHGVVRDVLWTGIMAAYRQSHMGLTCMLAPQIAYGDDSLPDEKQLLYYMKGLNAQRAEVGLSGEGMQGALLTEKLRADLAFMEDALPEYRFTSFAAKDASAEEMEEVAEVLPDVRTVVTDSGKREIIGYLSEYVTGQEAVADGLAYTFRDDFRVRCVETALGYTTIVNDITKAVYPKNEADTWSRLAEDLGWNTRHYWRNFRGFEGTTISESDSRIRTFLSLHYAQQREGQNIYLQVTGLRDKAWFVLRTRSEAVDGVQGGSWRKLEEDVYLIEAVEENVVITLENAGKTFGQ